jgi:hypothetical protein
VAAGVVARSANGGLLEGDPKTTLVSHAPEHGHGLGRDLWANAIARQHG